MDVEGIDPVAVARTAIIHALSDPTLTGMSR